MESLLPLQKALRGKKVVLASTSPRRKELLGLFGFEFGTVAPPFDESTIDPNSLSDVNEYVTELAKGKLRSALDTEQCKNADVVIASDTVVHLDGRILGKPGTHEKAYEYLKMLSGKNHNVLSGVAIAIKNNKKEHTEHVSKKSENELYDNNYTILTFAESTVVKMIDASDELLRGYANTNEPLDKAGAYAIQGVGGAHLIIGIDGDYSNVVGLPLCRLGMTLIEAITTIWEKEE